MLDPALLGASLYVPATHPRLEQVLAGRAYEARSVIACTEDSIGESEVDSALAQLRTVLRQLPEKTSGPLRFVRVRSPEVLQRLLQIPGVDRLHGVVIPKADQNTLPVYMRELEGSDLLVMPTIETIDAFERDAMLAFRRELSRPGVRERCLALRIGGNDLLNLLGMRRPRDCTLYETPIGTLIAQLVLTFKPHGFALTAPVFEYIDDQALLLAETRRDRAMGLVGKSAIHPSQLEVIESGLRPCEREFAAAQAVLKNGAPAVFKFDGAMMEAAVHRQWATRVLARAHAGSRRPPDAAEA
ncbi:ATP-binding protein [Solimonas sp. K1W22B-7]|uniref:HpcH/HpaI aldolase/citrate lyase family protein n=1 Tax=Solimonas sp. K1W22B-7 TaxID=2303331 RepID=UPI000E33446C|nr:HpcH/HpaI aldolase/citrate lyase family protein [Solimonas sp. K1W22B-7]AXQ27488.1 ATP-binding protein [Solimonas sp. K1W22B-7]